MAQPATNAKIEELRFKVKTDPKSRLFYPLAEELRKAGQTGEAEQVLRHGLTVHSTYLSAWVSLGRVLREQKKDGEAVEALTRALQLDPGNVVAARFLADAYLALGEKVEAIKKYKLVHALLPADEELKAQIDRLEQELHPPAPVPVAAPEPEPEREAEPIDFPEPEPPAPEPTAFPEPEPPAPEPTAFPAPEPPAPEPIAFPESEPPAPEPTAFIEPEPPAPEPIAFPEPEPPAPVLAAVEPQAEPEPEPLAAFSGDDTAVERPLPTIESPFEDALQSADAEQQREIETGDAVPMSVEHEESPFEEPVSEYTAAALTIEAPSGFHLGAAPLAADVPAPVYEEEPLPEIDAPVIASEPPAEEADVFAPSTPAEPVHAADDVASTITMADLYARQGLVDDARHIYETILARDPENAAVTAKLSALDRARTIRRLESWLAKVSRREVSSV